MARFVRYAICILLPLSAVAGCSHAARVSSITVSPFNGLTDQSAAESARLQQAQNMLIAACMHGRSYYFRVPHPPTPHGPAGNTYGLISPSIASRQGYGILDNFVVNREDNLIGIQAQPDAHHPGFESALTGTRASATTISLPGGGRISYNANGCVTIAINELYTPAWNKIYYTVNALALHIVSGVEASGTWKKAVLIWSRCVKQHLAELFRPPLPQQQPSITLPLRNSLICLETSSLIASPTCEKGKSGLPPPTHCARYKPVSRARPHAHSASWNNPWKRNMRRT